MAEVLPQYFYGDPANVVDRIQRGDVYRNLRCMGCRHWDMDKAPDPCGLKMKPGRHWCKGFDER